MIDKTKAIEYSETFEAGQNKMSSLKALWKSLLFYCIPKTEHLVWSRSMDQGEYDVPCDDTAIQSANIMASGIYSYTVTRGDRVADLSIQDQELNKDDDVQEYLSAQIKKATQLIHASNYPSAIFEMLLYYCVLGTDLLFSYYDKDLEKINFRCYRPFDCWIEEDASGKIHRVIRSEMMPHKNAQERWGTKIPEVIKKSLEKPESAIGDSEYLHIVERNPNYIPAKGATDENYEKSKLTKHFKYREVWIHRETKEVMSSDRGFRTFPYHTARSGVQLPNLPFGRSVAMDALPAIRGLHRADQWMTDASESEIRPPTLLPKGSVDPADWDDRPGARVVYNPIEGNGPSRLPVVTSIEPMDRWIQRKQMSVENFFFVPQFRALDQISGSNPTATEVNEAAKQGIQSIAPVIGTLEPDVYVTIVERILDIMDLENIGEAKPEILKDKDIIISISTRLDAELQNTDIRRTLVSLGQCFEIMKQFKENPEMAALVDQDKVIREVLYINNANPDTIFSERETKEKKKQLAEEQQRQQMMQMAMDKIQPIDPTKAPEPGSAADPNNPGGLGAI